MRQEQRVDSRTAAGTNNHRIDVAFIEFVAQRVDQDRVMGSRIRERIDIAGGTTSTVEQWPQLQPVNATSGVNPVERWQSKRHIVQSLGVNTTETENHDGSELWVPAHAQDHLAAFGHHGGN